MVDPTVQSYRFLRIGMVGAAVALAVAIGIERLLVDCWQPALSGYYHTPVRAIFIGSLMAIGLSLVVVRGRTDLEDTLLDVAGMLAPVVAVVPTTRVAECWSVAPSDFPLADGVPSEFLTVAIVNNMGALLITGALGLVVVVVIARLSAGSAGAMGALLRRIRWGLYVAGTLLVILAAGLAFWPDFPRRAHDLAAIALLSCLAAAVWINARASAAANESIYPGVYRGIAIAMIAPALLLLPSFVGFQHRVFVVEASEILLFAVFWLVQTAQHWRVDPSVRA